MNNITPGSETSHLNPIAIEKRRDKSPHTISPKEDTGDHQMFMEGVQKAKFQLRDIPANSRLNINNSNYLEQKIKRDRQISYWKNNVIALPAIRETSRK